MDPFEILVPVNRLLASPRPQTVPFARCRACGVYDCVGTDVTIQRSADEVRWAWLGRDARFTAHEYDVEVTRTAADRSWETPVRTAGRLILTHAQPLLPEGVRATSMIGVGPLTPDLFTLTLHLAGDYQIFLTFPWTGAPQELARHVCAVLAGPPGQWPARWHPVRSTLVHPPAIAGPSWRREQFWDRDVN
jgi:hypothetical protein